MADDTDLMSASGLVKAYLSSKGVPYTPENVRRAIEANARDSTVLGQPTAGPDPISGLRNYASNSDPGVGQSGTVARKIESKTPDRLPTPPIPEGAAPTGSDTSGTSASSGAGLDVGNIGQVIAGGLAAGGLGAGASYLWGNRPQPNYSLGMNESGQPAAAGGDRYALLPPTPEQQSPMELAMQRAVEPAGGVPVLGNPPSVSSANPMAVPSDVIGRPGLPPGVSDIDAVNAGQGMQGVTGSSMPGQGEGNIPIAPKRKVTIEEIHPQQLPDIRTRPRMRLFVP